MPEKATINYYGFFGLTLALISIGSYFVILTRSCIEYDYHQLSCIEITGAVTGLLVFIAGLIDAAEHLYKRKFIFYTIVVGFVGLGVLMFYGSVEAVLMTGSCTTHMYYERNFDMLRNSTRYRFDETEVDNWFQRKYGHNITLFIFNFTDGVLLWMIAYSFRKRF
ncbi:uncharacterized protein LOC128954213 [Oppia nitens]|uniref:uncharacterized protein LOC128954213 n=1 Tax=Oppia nitens TaxID=1686743 RepID=UPI0023DBBE93|nr:uncharacterized protein LOC128954213 [Oppia nitens]